MTPHVREEGMRLGPVEISDRASQEEKEELPLARAPDAHLFQTASVVAPDRDHPGARDARELAAAAIERRARNVDRVVNGGLPCGERLENPPRLSSTSAAELGERDRRGKPAHDGA